MSDSESSKSGRGKKRRMYQSFEEDVVNDSNSQKSHARESTKVDDQETVRQASVDQTKIEILEDIKFKGSLLSPNKQKELNDLVRSNIYWSMGFSVLPIPFVDSFLISATQLNMLKEISQKYNIPFHENKIKIYVATFAGSTSYHLGSQIIKSVLKKIPVIGAVSTLVSPVLAAATTYALAKVFIYHFELGGNLLDFKPEKVRAYFAKQFEDGKSKLHQMHNDFDFTNS